MHHSENLHVPAIEIVDDDVVVDGKAACIRTKIVIPRQADFWMERQ